MRRELLRWFVTLLLLAGTATRCTWTAQEQAVRAMPSSATSTSAAPQPKASDAAALPAEPPPMASSGAAPPYRELDLKRWRPAIEGYVVKVHNRVHPMFSDDFLASLDALPSWSALHQKGLFTNLEIVIGGEDGRVVRMGVVRQSGLAVFDTAALDSVDRAQPLGPAPKSIWSYDGNVYLHWEFHRPLHLACSSLNSRPFLLSAPALPTPRQSP